MVSSCDESVVERQPYARKRLKLAIWTIALWACTLYPVVYTISFGKNSEIWMKYEEMIREARQTFLMKWLHGKILYRNVYATDSIYREWVSSAYCYETAILNNIKFAGISESQN